MPEDLVLGITRTKDHLLRGVESVEVLFVIRVLVGHVPNPQKLSFFALWVRIRCIRIGKTFSCLGESTQSRRYH